MSKPTKLDVTLALDCRNVASYCCGSQNMEDWEIHLPLSKCMRVMNVKGEFKLKLH